MGSRSRLPFLFSYICCMRWTTWFKHALTLLGITTLVIGWVTFQHLEWKAEGFSESVLSGTFWILLSPVLLTFRASMIGQSKLHLVPTVLFVTLLAFLIVMYVHPASVFHLWDFALTFYTLLATLTCQKFIKGKGIASALSQVFLWLSFSVVLVGIVFRLESPVYFEAIKWTILLTSMVVLLQFFLPKKATR